MKKRAFAAVVLCLSITLSVQQQALGDDDNERGESRSRVDAVLAWNTTAADAMIVSGITPLFDPLHESRMYAMVHIAIHDALNAIDRRYKPYAYDGNASRRASPDAAVATAAHDVLVPLLQQVPNIFAPADVAKAVKLVDDRYQAALAAIHDNRAKEKGVAVGHDAAAAILALRAHDGADGVFLDFSYPEGTQAGQYRYVDGAPFAVAPKWGDVTPFVLHDGSEFRPPPPVDLTSAKYAADFNELKNLGDISSTVRTAEQTEIAFFWFESSPLRWNRIARTASQKAHLDMWDNARLFGLLNMAEADGYIGNWESKYTYNRWRPETAVRLAATDGNPLTTPNTTWRPLWGSSGATPEYDSGHTIEGAASAEVLRRIIGTDRMTFKVCSYTLPANTCTDASPKTRTYRSFSQAANENGISRILVGWHFRNAVEQGFEHGDKIGKRAVDQFLRPVRERD